MLNMRNISMTRPAWTDVSLYVCLSVSLYLCLSVYICLCLCLSVQLQVYSTVHWCSIWEISSWWDRLEPTSLSISASACLCVCLYVSLCLSVCISVYLSVQLQVYSTVHQCSVWEISPWWDWLEQTSLSMCVCLSVYVSIYVYLCLSVCLFSYKSIVQYIDAQYEKYLHDETGLNRRNIVDGRVHCCFYFINPSGHGSVLVFTHYL